MSEKTLIAACLYLVFSYTYAACCQPINAKQPSSVKAYTPPQSIQIPDTRYKVEFIVFAARHGSRFANNSSKHIDLRNKLDAYNKQKMLSITGKNLLFELKRYLFSQQHNFAGINKRGKSEYFLLAKRLVDTYPLFFQKKQHFVAYSTHKKRTQQSMHSFIDGLSDQPISLIIDKHIFKKGKDPVLRFIDIYPPYRAYIKKLSWRNQGISFIGANNYQKMIKRITSQLFNPYLGKQMLTTNRMDDAKIIYLLYYYLIYLDDDQVPENTVITSLFSAEEIGLIYQLDNLKNFYKYGPGHPDNQQSVKAAAAFIIFINHYFYQVKTGRSPINGVLLFAHNETLLPVITLLNIDNLNNPQDNFDQKTWSSRAIMPMAGNLSWIILSKKKSLFVQIRLNEKPVSIPALGKAKDNIYTLDQFIQYTEKHISASAIDFGELAKLYRLTIPDLIDSLTNTLSRQSL